MSTSDTVPTVTHLTVEYYSGMKRNRLLLVKAATWVNLKGTVPSEKSQSQKLTYYVIAFITFIYRYIT